MNNIQINNPEIEQQVQEMAAILTNAAIEDARKQYLMGVVAGMQYANTVAPPAKAEAEGESRTA